MYQRKSHYTRVNDSPVGNTKYYWHKKFLESAFYIIYNKVHIFLASPLKYTCIRAASSRCVHLNGR